MPALRFESARVAFRTQTFWYRTRGFTFKRAIFRPWCHVSFISLEEHDIMASCHWLETPNVWRTTIDTPAGLCRVQGYRSTKLDKYLLHVEYFLHKQIKCGFGYKHIFKCDIRINKRLSFYLITRIFLFILIYIYIIISSS